MNPGPQLHRSLTFWAGLILILFTCWAWRDSCQNFSMLNWKKISATSVSRGFMIARYTGATRPRPEVERLPATSYFTDLKQEILPAPFLVQYRKAPLPTGHPDSWTLKQLHEAGTNISGPGSWCLFIPYWLILLSTLLTWTALLFFRARRRRAKLLQTS